ncbi:MAG: Ig-like domain-containing protein [Reichenbachiella sp.]|uniref:right-handed parallel beta-helix repeat-containing protein n=1 Tax=Reichenbachiella sp. TaxID=2184521 RepID=UPI002967313D|nr:Ig-like domain-containing protein [Reichenbachiella sp.]MDW3209312.1 Ig-like domain-containing protein [Reichenbachiella sp.]
MKGRFYIYRMITWCFILWAIGSCGEDEVTEEIEEEVIFATSIVLTGEDLETETQRQLQVTFVPDNTTDQSVAWSVSDAAIAEISSTGLLTAKQNGTVTVTATALDQSTVTADLTLEISSIYEPSGEDIEVATAEELVAALADIAPGDVILLAGGTYAMTDRIVLNTSGTAAELITVMADPEATERPILDFSVQEENSSNQGIQLKANYWHFKGLDIRKAGDNGMQIKGSNNTIEFCSFYENSDTGLQLDDGAADNLILNCDSYYNADASVENADGFAAKLGVGSGNKFVGCRAWQNLDDGWDGYLRGADHVQTEYESCWAIKNGIMKSGEVGGGDGNGFKTGGSDDKDLSHHATYKNCLAIGNVFDGFDHNSNRGAVSLYNCAAYDNGTNYNFSSSNALASLEVKNCAVVGATGSLNATSKDITFNSWQDELSATSDDYESLAIDLLLGERQADGSLPEVDFMQLVSGSDLIDAGTNVGLTFQGQAPDIGVFEKEN